jgi:hypothetical protein
VIATSLDGMDMSGRERMNEKTGQKRRLTASSLAERSGADKICKHGFRAPGLLSQPGHLVQHLCEAAGAFCYYPSDRQRAPMLLLRAIACITGAAARFSWREPAGGRQACRSEEVVQETRGHIET